MFFPKQRKKINFMTFSSAEEELVSSCVSRILCDLMEEKHGAIWPRAPTTLGRAGLGAHLTYECTHTQNALTYLTQSALTQCTSYKEHAHTRSALTLNVHTVFPPGPGAVWGED